MGRVLLVRWRVGLALVALGACKPDIPNTTFACETPEDCPSGFACVPDEEDALRCQERNGERPAGCDDFTLDEYEGTPLWTTSDVSACRALCPSLDDSCAKVKCARGVELAKCLSENESYCAFGTGGKCHDDFSAFTCCMKAHCADISDEEARSECSRMQCSVELYLGSSCLSENMACRTQAWNRCSALARPAPSAPANDAGMARDAGTDAGLTRDGGVDAAVKLDASVDPALPPNKDAAAPRTDASITPNDAGAPPADAGAGF
jgi:hypothetical protein